MTDQNHSYKQAFKATSIFGGAQIILVIVGILKTKIAAVLLGTSGIGLFGLMTAPLALVNSFTNLGISQSAVRDLSNAYEKNDQNLLSKTYLIFRNWTIVTGLLGTFCVICFSPLFSKTTFGSFNHFLVFCVLSLTLFFNSISNGQITLLKSLRRIKESVTVSLLGSILSLLITIPIFIFWKKDGIAIAILISSLIILPLSSFYTHRLPIIKKYRPFFQTIKEGKSIVQLGTLMTLSGIITQATTYLIILIINKFGGQEEVGLYNASFAITSQLVNMVFTAMASDYYPRLSAIYENNDQIRITVNQQAEIAILILSPFIVLLIGFMPLVIQILYTTTFLSISNLTQLFFLGLFFKTACWAIGFIILAKGDSILFFIVETLGNIILFVSSIIGYHLKGLDGLGFGFILTYILFLILLFVIVYKNYKFKFSKDFYTIFTLQLSLSICIYFSIQNLGDLKSKLFSVFMFTGSSIFSLYYLNKRIDFVKALGKFRK